MHDNAENHAGRLIILNSHDYDDVIMKTSFLFYQLFESGTSTYSYLLADPESREAVLIDSVLDTAARDLKFKHILDTHVCDDHILVQQKTGTKTAVTANDFIKTISEHKLTYRKILNQLF